MPLNSGCEETKYKVTFCDPQPYSPMIYVQIFVFCDVEVSFCAFILVQCLLTLGTKISLNLSEILHVYLSFGLELLKRTTTTVHIHAYVT